MSDFNGYKLSRDWFDWTFENPDVVKPVHSALYFYCIDLCNRLGWKEKFGLPTYDTMEGIGVKNYRTFKKAFNDLAEWGFIRVVTRSRNQHTATVIALVKNTKANTKAKQRAIAKNTKALPKHIQKHCSYNKTGEQGNNIPFETFWNAYGKKVDREKARKKWEGLSAKDQQQAIEHIPKYIAATPDKQYRKYPATYLNNKTWLDEELPSIINGQHSGGTKTGEENRHLKNPMYQNWQS